MNPIKPREISKRLAKQLNEDEELVDDVLNFFYKSLRESASNMEDLKLKIPKFGFLKFRYYRSQKTIEKNQQAFDSFNKETDSHKVLREEFLKNIEAIKALKIKYEALRQNHQDKKKNFEKTKKTDSE